MNAGRETKGSVFMCWSEQSWHHIWLIMAHSRLFFFFGANFIIISFNWIAHYLRSGAKNDNFVVYFYFQISTVCNYVANILTCAVKL